MKCMCGYGMQISNFCPECGRPLTVLEKVPEPKDEILTSYEAAEFLKISRWKIYDLIRKGQIPYKAIGTQKRFTKAQLIEWLQKSMAGQSD